MTRIFKSAEELADVLQFRTEPCIKAAFEKALERAAKIARKTAYDMVGHSQPGLWAALSSNTIRIKRKNNWGLNGNPASPLYATGALRASIASEVDKANLRGSLGSNVAYAGFHELGTARMPARPLIRPALERAVPETRAECSDIMKKALEI